MKIRSVVQSELHFEYDEELSAFLRRRVWYWSLTWLVFWALQLLVSWPTAIVCGIIVGVSGYTVRRSQMTSEESRRVAFWMITSCAAVVVVLGGLGSSLHIPGVSWSGSFSGFALFHILAAIFLPWTLLQAIQPGIALFLIWLVAIVVFGRYGSIDDLFARSILAGVYLTPGLVICSIKNASLGQFFETNVLRRYRETFTQEVLDAKRLHDAIFPPPNLDGAIRFTYQDNPRFGIGGDFVHARYDKRGWLHLGILDVAGDGIAAALTVNRLHGELERLYAEDDTMMPDVALAALDRYATLTLAPLGIYAVALFFFVPPRGELWWSGAGHTPAFIRRANQDDTFERLESTTWPLGASPDADPKQCAMKTQIHPGDVLIGHTDGACEELNEDGTRWGYSGVATFIQNATGPSDPLDWPRFFLHTVEQRRGVGRVHHEDVLAVAITLSHNSTSSGSDTTDSESNTMDTNNRVLDNVVADDTTPCATHHVVGVESNEERT